MTFRVALLYKTPERSKGHETRDSFTRCNSMRLLLIVGTIVAIGCGTRQAVLEAGPATISPRLEAAPAVEAPPGFWSDTIRPLATLSRGWNRIPGRFGTGCAHDSAFAFKVRPGLPDKVFIYLNGGGACWRAQECDPKGKPTYTMSADSANDVSARTGIFDYTNEKNPVHDYTMVFVPYCTGDLHLGTRESEYDGKDAKGIARKFSVRHGGAANLEFVLDYVYANVKTPRVVLVAGSSAGAVASPVVAEKVARHYPRARVVQLGDAAGGFRDAQIPSLLYGWGATDYLKLDQAFRSVDSADFTFERLYVSAARAAPRVQYAQFNTIEDATQVYFLSLLGVKAAPLPKFLAENLAEIKRAVPSFRSYTAPGKVHTILRSNAVYTTKVDGVVFRDWLQALVDGDVVADVGGSLLVGKGK